MKKVWITISVLFLFLGVSAQEVVVDANAEMREISGSFHTIIVSDGIDLYLSQSDHEAVAVSSSDEKNTGNIKSVVENNVLTISFEGSWSSRKGRKLKAYVSFKKLVQLEAKGASDILISDAIRAPALLVRLSGASDFRGNIYVDTLQLDLSGASDLQLKGTASVVTIESSGASDVKAFDLITSTCTAKASGASDISITVTNELTAHASGASNIFYKGDAIAKDIKSRGASIIAKKRKS